MPENKNTIDNILLSGYLREHEEYIDIEIPELVTSIISVYCKQYTIQTVGSLQELEYKSNGNVLDSINKLKDINESKVFKSNSNPTDTHNISTKKTSSPFRTMSMFSDYTLNEQIDDIMDNGFITDINDKIIDIASGSKHILFLTSNGNVYGFGDNDSGQLGLGKDISFITIPTLIPFECKIKSIACGELHSLFIDENGKLLVSGFNYSGQLGIKYNKIEKKRKHSYSESHRMPCLQQSISTDCNVMGVMGADEYDHDDIMCFIDDDEDITDSDDTDDDNIGFGRILESDDDDDNDDYFDFDDADTDDDIDDNDDDDKFKCIYSPIYNEYFDFLNIRFISIECGSYHSLGITTNGECYTFGHNGFGNLGNGTCTQWGKGINIPYKLKINKKFIAASCGKNHNILTTQKNEIIVFGDNKNNQCSVINKNHIEVPYVLSKKKEFGMNENCFVEKVICSKNQSISILMIDTYKRYQL